MGCNAPRPAPNRLPDGSIDPTYAKPVPSALPPPFASRTVATSVNLHVGMVKRKGLHSAETLVRHACPPFATDIEILAAN